MRWVTSCELLGLGRIRGGRALAYHFTVDESTCFNCGVCMDVCPHNSLDMTRPKGPGPWGEFNREQAEPYGWMMEFPVQVDKCTGCGICASECPVQAVRIRKVEGPVEYATRGMSFEEPEGNIGWQPLSAYTRAAARKGPKRDPWPRRAFVWKSLVMARRKKRLELS